MQPEECRAELDIAKLKGIARGIAMYTSKNNVLKNEKRMG